MKLELYINDQLADINDQTIIAITKTYEKAENPLNYYADFSKTVSLPLSKANNAIFSNFNRLDSLVTNLSIDPAKKLSFVILDNKQLVLKGYAHLDNSNTAEKDGKYEITLYSSFADIINELKQLTFNPYADVDPRYIITKQWLNNATITRNVVKRSFEQESHLMDSEDVIDWIGFIPTYQGKYSDFSSDKVQTLPNGRTEDMSQERDEHYTREFRSYQQQPFFWVDKLWKVTKEKIEDITDYTLNLDPSWFSLNNPYYKDLIYTCPTLMNTDDNYKEYSERFETQMFVNFPSMYGGEQAGFVRVDQSKLTERPNPRLTFNHLVKKAGDNMYSNGVFNPNSNYGATVFKGKFKLTLFSPKDLIGFLDGYAKIQEDNPFYVTVRATTTNGTPITGAKRTFLLYSGDHNASEYTYDEAIDLGITRRSDPSVTIPVGNREVLYRYSAPPDHTIYHDKWDGYFWETNIEFSLNIAQNVPYKIEIDIHNNNLHRPFEYADAEWIPQWDWLWTDLFYTDTYANGDKGFSFYVDVLDAEVTTQENVRSFSPLNFYRVFPKDVSLMDVLLNYSKMFGLVWTVDEETKTVSVMTRNRFFADYEILDWTDKVDRSKDFKIVPLNFDKKYVLFNFDEGKCHRLEQYEDKYETTYGTKKLDTGFEFNSDENELFKNLQPSVISQKKQYSMLYNTEYEDRPAFMGYSFMIYPNERYVDNDNEGQNAGMSGAFYFRNGTFTPDERLTSRDNNNNPVIRITDDTAYQIQTQSYCWNLSGENIALCNKIPDVSTISNTYNGKRYSVHFAAPKEYYFKQPNGTVKYIYDTRWKQYIDERYCSQNKKLTAYLYITLEDFHNIDFRQFVKIDNILYAIDKIYDYNFNSTEPVKMDLVQVWNLPAYTTGQDEMPYLFTEDENVLVTTTSSEVTVYASGEFTVDSYPDWMTCTKNDSKLRIRANASTNHHRVGYIVLSLNGYTNFTYSLAVHQNAVADYLEVFPETLVFDHLGGTETVEVNSSSLDLNDLPISVYIINANWITATLYQSDYAAARNKYGQYLLNITVAPNQTTRPRNGVVTLRMTSNGTTYTADVHIGQLSAYRYTSVDERDLADYTIYNANNQTVSADALVAGEEYHFQDYFTDQVIPSTVHISNGSVNISGTAGLQTITFTPLFSNEDINSGATVSGGRIVIQTVNGARISYNYMVNDSVAPIYTRNVVVSATGGGMFRIVVNGGTAQTLSNYNSSLQDGDVVTLTAQQVGNLQFQRWTDNNGNTYSTPQVTFTVSSALEVNGYIGYTASYQSGGVLQMVMLTVDPNRADNSTAYITFGNDSTQYTTVATKTVPIGTTITDVKANNGGSGVFQGWSDGSSTNPRDIVMTGDKTISVIWNVGMLDYSIIADANGFIGNPSDTLWFNFNSDPNMQLKAIAGTTERGLYARGTNYTLNTWVTYDVKQSKLNSIVIGGNSYYTDTVTISNYSHTADNVAIKVTMNKYSMYYGFGDYTNDLRNDQQIIFDGQRLTDYGLNTVIEVRTDPDVSDLTVCIPSEYKVIGAELSPDGILYNQIQPDSLNVLTDNGLWSVTYISDTDPANNRFVRLKCELV